MLGNIQFYHKLTRKAVVLFGRLFDDITVIRKNDQTGKETNRFLVPIIYAPKEKMVTRILSDPDLLRSVGAILPRMSFEITGISYDSSRKQGSLIKMAVANNSTRGASTYMGVPYDITFALNIYTRNIDDGTQIVEQILPFFNPDFTVTTNMVPDLNILKDIPIILNSVSNDVEYEGNYDSVRYVNWTLNFTMKAHYYGPITYPKIIRTVYANIYNDPRLKSGYITKLNLTSANGIFKVEDLVYQGNSYKTANAYGFIVNYSENNVLTLGAVQGQFKVNNKIHAVSTNANAIIDSFYIDPLKLVEIKITPDPITAEPEDDYGYTVDITEWPASEFKYEQPPAPVEIYTVDSTIISVDRTDISVDNG